MESLDTSFWIGLAAAVPLSVLANLFTPKIQQALARKSKARAFRRSAQIKAELEEIERLTSEPGRLQTFLLESVLLITLLTSAVGVISGLFFAFANMYGASPYLTALGQFVAVGGGVGIMRECLDVLRKSRRARDTEKYKVKVQKELSELNPIEGAAEKSNALTVVIPLE